MQSVPHVNGQWGADGGEQTPWLQWLNGDRKGSELLPVFIRVAFVRSLSWVLHPCSGNKEVFTLFPGEALPTGLTCSRCGVPWVLIQRADCAVSGAAFQQDLAGTRHDKKEICF